MTHTADTGVRIDGETFRQIIPEMAAGMATIARAIHQSGIDAGLVELIKIRV